MDLTDLPAPAVLWATWRRLEEALGALDVDDVWWTREPGRAEHDDHGGSSLHLQLVAGGRAVLWGYDRDGGLGPGDVTSARPPVDLFAGAPGWVPTAEPAALVPSEQLGWLSWFVPASGWSRAPYPPGVGDSSARLLAPLTDGDDALADLLADWAQDEDEQARARSAADAAVVEPPRGVPAAEHPRPRPVAATVEEQLLVAEAAAREAAELPRPEPAATAELAAVSALARELSAGAPGEVAAWCGASSAAAQPSGSLEVPGRFGDLLHAVRALREAEGRQVEHGRWAFVRVLVADGSVHVERAFDTVPAWWERESWESPSLPELAELRSRPPRWRPEWTDLLDPRVRTDGFPARYAALAARVLDRDVRVSPAGP